MAGLQNPKAFAESTQDMIYCWKMRLYGQKTKSTISDIDFDTSEGFFQKWNFLMV